jgi:hypothetical protein
VSAGGAALQGSGRCGAGFRRSTETGTIAPDSALVPSPISQKPYGETWEEYDQSFRVKRPFNGDLPDTPDRTGTELQGFSDKSRGRLRFKAANAGHYLISQFCLTYHNLWPIDGREFKRQVNLFLTRVRQQFKSVRYLWVGEFQKRGCPHLHFYSSIPVSPENHEFLAQTWHSIADPDSGDHLIWHRHPSTFIEWEMHTGSYLCKYLDKKHQKAIPEGFQSFGRWWGASRGLVDEPEITTPEEIDAEFSYMAVDPETGEILEEFKASTWVLRQIGRYHEHKNRRSWFRKTNRTTSVLTGAPIFRQLLEYLRRQPPLLQPVPF